MAAAAEQAFHYQQYNHYSMYPSEGGSMPGRATAGVDRWSTGYAEMGGGVDNDAEELHADFET
jgi:hypothetical protein